MIRTLPSREHFIIYALYCWNLIWCFMSFFFGNFYSIRLKSVEKKLYFFRCNALVLSKVEMMNKGKIDVKISNSIITSCFQCKKSFKIFARKLMQKIWNSNVHVGGFPLKWAKSKISHVHVFFRIVFILLFFFFFIKFKQVPLEWNRHFYVEFPVNFIIMTSI